MKILITLLIICFFISGCYTPIKQCLEWKDLEKCSEWEYYDSPCPSKVSINNVSVNAGLKLCCGKKVSMLINQSQKEDFKVLEYEGTEKVKGKCLKYIKETICTKRLNE